MTAKKLSRAVVELLTYLLVSFLTCVVVELILRRHAIGPKSISVSLWAALPMALAVTVGVWLGKVLFGCRHDSNEAPTPKC